MREKHCVYCLALKPLSYFRLHAQTLDGYQHACKMCVAHRPSPVNGPQSFWDYVQKTSTCWPWLGAQRWQGYGVVRWTVHEKMRKVSTHRVAWFLTHGRWPSAGLCICHTCDNRLCCRPDHLFEGTTQDNRADAVSKGRQARGASINLARLHDDDIPLIRSLYRDEHVPQTHLAQRFGVTQGTIGKIVRRETWRHVS